MKLREDCMGAKVCTVLNILNADFPVMTPCTGTDVVEELLRPSSGQKARQEKQVYPW